MEGKIENFLPKVPCLTPLVACDPSKDRNCLITETLRDGSTFPSCSVFSLQWKQRNLGGLLCSLCMRVESPDWTQLKSPTIRASSTFTCSDSSSCTDLQRPAKEKSNMINDQIRKSNMLWLHGKFTHRRVVPMRLWNPFPRWWRRTGKARTAAALTDSSRLCSAFVKTHTRHVSHTPPCRKASSDTQSASISGAGEEHRQILNL